MPWLHQTTDIWEMVEVRLSTLYMKKKSELSQWHYNGITFECIILCFSALYNTYPLKKNSKMNEVCEVMNII